MTMLRPTYSISLGGDTISSDTLRGLVTLEVERAKNAGADRAVVALGRIPDVSPSEGDPAAIELGWDGDNAVVFTGEVAAVDRGVLGLEVTCAGTQALLHRARGDRTFVDQSAGDVFSTLASDAGADTDTVEDGIRLPVYLADSSRSALGHCLALARRCGFDLYATPDGALVFASFAPSAPDVTFRYGVDVISASVERTVPPDGVTVVPESPASGQGDDTSSWLVKDPSSYAGQSGGSPGASVSDPVLRTRDAADSAALARTDGWARAAVNGRLQATGNTDVALGGTVQVDGMADDALNDRYQVMAVRHVLDRARGFRTLVALGGLPGGGP